MYGVIDVGSNSIRLMRHDGVNTIDKRLIVTGLAKGLAHTGEIAVDALERTENAIVELYGWGVDNGCRIVYVFATEAVRSAKNGNQLSERLKKHNIKLEVISGEEEAEIGFVGAYTSGLVGIIDIGGASSELVVGDEKGIIAGSSAKIGAMRLLDLANENRAAAEEILKEKLSIYESNNSKGCSCDKLIAIGGTATTFAAIDLKLEVYDSKIVDGYILKLENLERIINTLQVMSVEDRKRIKGLMPQRAEVIVSGGYILSAAMRMCNKKEVMISEKDNLEGYLIKKLRVIASGK